MFKEAGAFEWNFASGDFKPSVNQVDSSDEESFSEVRFNGLSGKLDNRLLSSLTETSPFEAAIRSIEK